jgi:PmbA protein
MTELVDLSVLQDRAEALVAAAMRAGADAADVVVAAGRSLSVDVRNGALEENQRAEADQLGLRVFLGRRQAIVSTSDPDPASYSMFAERALAMARVAPEDPYAGLAPEDRLARSFPELDLYDGGEFTAAELEAFARTAEEAALAVPGVTRSSGAGASQSHGGFVLVTSGGFSGSYRRSSFSFAMSAVAGEGTAMQVDHDHAVALHRADLDDPARIGRSAGERAVSALDPRKIETQRASIVFDRRVSGRIVSWLARAANGASIARGTSFLKERLGQQIFPKGVAVLDDPLRPRGLGSRPFDDEGVASAPLALVDDGVLTSWVLDSATARELGLSTTGHASRGASSAPSPHLSNVTIAPGVRSRDALLRSVGRGLLVTKLIGSGADIVTGDYSGGCFGFWFENGEIAYPVAEVTIAGRLDEMFLALSPADDLELRYGVDAPTCLVGEMTIAGR